MHPLESPRTIPITRPKTALLLIAHGSRQAEANADLLHLTEQLRAQGVYSHVQPSFMELAKPTIEEGGDLCVLRGAEQVILLPYFLSSGIHVQRDLAEACRHLAERHASVRFRLAQPLGRHPLLAEIVLERAREAERDLC